MRALLIPAVLVAGLSVSPLAFANEMAAGTIKSIDAKAHTLTLEDGKVYSLPKDFKSDSVKPGEKVDITWEMKDGKNEASKVTVVK